MDVSSVARADEDGVAGSGRFGAKGEDNILRQAGVLGDECFEVRRREGAAVSVVVPTLNEAENLPHVLTRIPSHYEVVLVDGNSTDGTPDVARDLRPDARVLTQSRRGKGEALACGFAAARGDIIVMLDADGSAKPEEIASFVDALLDGADFAKGSRFVEGGGSHDITQLRRMGNTVLSGLVNLLFRTHYTDLCYGFNAFWRHCLPAMAVDCDGFEVETLINIRVARAGLRVVEVPSFEDSRIHGASNLRTFKDGWRVLRTIVRERLRDAPEDRASEEMYVEWNSAEAPG